MKLATFITPSGLEKVGLVVGDGIIGLADHIEGAPDNMVALMRAWPELKDQVASLSDRVQPDFQLKDIQLRAPVPNPGKILGIGLNYADHVAESGMDQPDDQLWFLKASTSVNDPYAVIERPVVSETLDYEAELAFVIGKRCRFVSREDAPQMIFGYCVANDVSVRDWQLRTSQFMLGKSFDTHAPYGPWIVTADEIDDPHDLQIRCFVNDEKRQDSNTKNLIFNCYEQIEHLSKVMTLEPGDVIMTGTPGGIGGGFKPPRWLRHGDLVRVEIENLGVIENRVEDARQP